MEWQPIETLKLKHYSGYAVSEEVMLADYYQETGVRRIRIGRVWAENGVRSLPDNGYVEYHRVTHWQPLPAPPISEGA